MMIKFQKIYKEQGITNFNVRYEVFFLYLAFAVLTSCNYKERYSIISPKGDSQLIFEWVNTFNPHKKGYIKIYSSNSSESSVSIIPIMDFPIHIYWGDTIKIRGGILVSDETSFGILNWKRDYTKLEEMQVIVDTINWKHYYLNKIPEGYYK